MRILVAALLAGAACLSIPAAAAPKKDAKADEKWSVEAPKGAVIKQVAINTDEGTWMDVDVAPDGKTLAFTLLGDIYTLPIEGGTPKRISEGMSWDVQPRFSPDGTRIAFTSDRGGGDNIWVMNADGSDKRQVTKEDFRLLNQPAWSPDGRFIAAKKHYTTERSAGTGEVWLYHVSGGGGVQVVERASEALQKELGEPVFAPDGSAIYYTRNVTPGPIFEYAQDSNAGIFAIERHDLATGEVTAAVSGYGGAVRPAPSPDGKEIAFVRRDKDQTQLWVKDLASGRERMIYGKLDMDVQETWAVTGVYPNMDWLPDSSGLVFWAGGKLNRVSRDGSGHAVIPFRVNDTRGVADAPHPVIAVAPDSFTTTMPRFATLSPDGSRVVFESLGRLYSKSAKGKDAPAPLTGDNADVLEAFPAFSRDGGQLAYVRWNDAKLGEIVLSDASGQNRRVLTGPGHYGNLAFSPDGTMLAFEKREGGYLTSPDYSEAPGIYVMATSGGEAKLVTRDGANPQWGAANDRLFMVARDGGNLALVSTDLNGEAKRTHAKGDLANDLRIAPDGRNLAFRQNYEVFAMPLVPGGKPVDVSETGGSLPVTKVSTGGADYLGWANGGATLFWSIGPSLQSASIPALFANAPKAEDGKTAPFTPPTTGIPLQVTVQKAMPTGVIAFVGAKILTMAHRTKGVIDVGTVVVSGDRILAVGTSDGTAIPKGATIIDASGKVIMTGRCCRTWRWG